MKKILLMALVAASSAQAASDSARITITGNVLSNTCTIDNGSANQTVVLPDISDRDISGKGKLGGLTNVTIKLNDCGTAASEVEVSASGNQDDEDATAFSNSVSQEDGGATGVGVYFYHTDGATKFLPDGSVTQVSKLTPLSDNTLNYQASYVGINDTVTAGPFSTVVNMTFTYQ
ncbi:fimbrial protein [Enterobacter hormaechei]